MKFDDKNIQIMMSLYREIFLMKSNNISLYRHLKLKLIADASLTPNIKLLENKNFLFKNRYWKTIQKFSPKVIITGSLALKAFGIITRPIDDLDFIVFDDTIDYPDHKVNRKYFEDNYPNNILGTYLENKMIIDFYSYSNQTCIEYNGLKFHNPYEILRNKLDLVCIDGHTKHFIDLRDYFNKTNISLNQ